MTAGSGLLAAAPTDADGYRPLPTYAQLHAELPVPATLREQILGHREQIRRVLDGSDDRLLVVVGPCSLHDPVAGLDYAGRLAAQAARLAPELLVVMRAYLEKPRSVLGWRGLVPDPDLDGRGDLRRGLGVGRGFLRDAAAGTGLPLAVEFVDPLLTPYVADLVSWAAIGARTVGSPPHRQLAAGLPMPVGCKNGLDGDVGVAVDALLAAGVPHLVAGLDRHGRPGVREVPGNPWAHLVLRGGSGGTNYDAASVDAALARLAAQGLPRRLVVDASHGNSGKDHRRQPAVVADLADQLAAGQRGLVGVMVESFLGEGRQDRPERYGVSITDGCLGWDATVAALETLATATRRRRG